MLRFTPVRLALSSLLLLLIVPSVGRAQTNVAVTNTVRALLNHAGDGYPVSVRGIRGERIFASADERTRFEAGKEPLSTERLYLSDRVFGSEPSYIRQFKDGMRAYIQGGLDGIGFETLMASARAALPGAWEAEDIGWRNVRQDDGRIGRQVTSALWKECEGDRGRSLSVRRFGVDYSWVEGAINGPILQVNAFPTPCPGQAMRDWQLAEYGVWPTSAIPVRTLSPNTKPSGRMAYLQQIRGANGEDIQFVKLDSCCEFLTGTYRAMLDRYRITYPGQKAPVILHLNMYEEAPETIRAPAGLSLAPAAGSLRASSPRQAYVDGKAAYEGGNRYRSLYLLRHAVEGGVQEAEYYLGEHAFHGTYMRTDYAVAAELFRHAAETGEHIDARVHLGEILLRGLGGLPKDPAEAHRLFALAEEEGGRVARFWLGRTYELGAGTEKDLDEAIRLYRLAADDGHANAQHNLAYLLLKGEGVGADAEEARELFERAAAQNFRASAFQLGRMYEHGNGVTEDKERAARWYQNAADAGHASAKNNLGVLYLNGTGVRKDEQKAAGLFGDAAYLGNAVAHANLAYMYREGRGVEENCAQAIELYRKAAEKGYQPGTEKADALESEGC